MLEERWFALADRLARSVCRRHGLRREAEEEFCSVVRLRMAERGEQILAAHDGRSTVEGYLLVVLERLRQDWQRNAWGSWRPSREAQRLGPVAIELERLTTRDGVAFDQAAQELLGRFGPRASREELEGIRARLPVRAPRREVPEAVLEEHPAREGSPGEALDERERGEMAKRAGTAVLGVLRTLDVFERLLLVLVFREGLSVRAAARGLGLEHKKVGRRLERILDRLRQALAEGGVDRHGLLLLLEGPLPGEEGWLGPAGESRWDTARPGPSSPEGAEP